MSLHAVAPPAALGRTQCSSCTPIAALRQVAGFTLLEVLVVMVIIGIIVASVTVSVGVLGRDREAEDQARRFWAVLQQAREEGELQGLDLGVVLTRSSYEFVRLDGRNNVWMPITDDRLFTARELPAGLQFRVWLDGREVVLKLSSERAAASDGDEDERAALQPQIMALSSGELMPFTMEVQRDMDPAVWRVVGHPDGNLSLERRNRELDDWIVVTQTHPMERESRLAQSR